MLLGGYAVKQLPARVIVTLSFVGLLNVSVFLVLFNIGLTTISPGVASTLVYTQPVFVAAFAPLIGESLSRRKILGVAAAFGGVAVIFISSFSAFTLVAGDLMVLGSSVSWAASILIYKKWKVDADSRVVSAAQLLAGSAFILPVLAFQKPFLEPTVLFWLYLAFNVILATGFGYVIFWRILSRMPASEMTSYLFLVPVLTTIMGSVLALSIPAWNEIAGTLLVAFGIVVTNR